MTAMTDCGSDISAVGQYMGLHRVFGGMDLVF